MFSVATVCPWVSKRLSSDDTYFVPVSSLWCLSCTWEQMFKKDTCTSSKVQSSSVLTCLSSFPSPQWTSTQRCPCVSLQPPSPWTCAWTITSTNSSSSRCLRSPHPVSSPPAPWEEADRFHHAPLCGNSSCSRSCSPWSRSSRSRGRSSSPSSSGSTSSSPVSTRPSSRNTSRYITHISQGFMMNRVRCFCKSVSKYCKPQRKLIQILFQIRVSHKMDKSLTTFTREILIK